MRISARWAAPLAALLLVSATASATPASADGRTRRGVDGCFAWSWTPGFAVTNFYYSNRCRKAHRIRINWGSNVEAPETIRVKGETKGSTWSTLSNGVRSVEDLGPVR